MTENRQALGLCILAIVAAMAILTLGIWHTACSSRDGSKVPSASELRPVREFQQLDGISWFFEALAFSKDGRHVASGARDKLARLWDVSSGSVVQTFQGHASQVTAVALSPDGKRLATGSGERYGGPPTPQFPNDSTLRVWDVSSGKELKQLSGHSPQVSVVVFSPDGRTLVSGDTDGRCILWDMDRGEERARLPSSSGAISALAFSPDGSQLLCATEGGQLSLYDAATATLIRNYGDKLGTVSCVAFSTDGKLLISGHNKMAARKDAASKYFDCSVRIWDTASGAMQHYFSWQAPGPYAVGFSPDNKHVVGALNHSFKVWELPQGREVAHVRADCVMRPAALFVSPDRFIAVSPNVGLYLYEVAVP
jgi:WD40 repeat protein